MDLKATGNSTIHAIKPTSGDPYSKRVQDHKLDLNTGRPCRKFELRCHAGDAGRLEVTSNSASVRIGQLIHRDGKEELWGSLLVECSEQDDGSLAVEVLVYHPDWDEPLRIASIQSTPSNGNPEELGLRFDFKQKQL